MLAALRSLKVHLRANWFSIKRVSEDVYALPHPKKCTPPFTNVFSWPKQKPCNRVDMCGGETLRIDTSSLLCVEIALDMGILFHQPVSWGRVFFGTWDYVRNLMFHRHAFHRPCRGWLKPKRTTNLYQWRRSVLVRLLHLLSWESEWQLPWM